MPEQKQALEGKLEGRVALVTGGGSGVGRAVAIAFAREGADVAIVALDEDPDAVATRAAVERLGRRCLTIAGDVGDQAFCHEAVARAVRELGRLDVLVNNAAEQHAQRDLERTFRTNIFSHFYMTTAALEHMAAGACVINTTSVTPYRGSDRFLDYAATKGAIVAFTRSLARALAEKRIRVNALGLAGEPEKIASSYVFLASDDASALTGQVLHPDGAEIGDA